MPLIATRPVAEDGASFSNIADPFEALTAAGVPIAGSTGGSPAGIPSESKASGDWKQTAWSMYDNVGELRYVCAWLANALSRCALVGSDIDPSTGQPTGHTDSELVRDTVAAIAGGPAGQAALLGRLATYLTVPGEGFVAIIVRTLTIDEVPHTVEEWYVLSTDEVKKSGSGQGGVVTITLPDGSKHELNDETDTLARIYRPHPRKSWESDSPVRAAIPILREIVHLGQHIEATTKSRLAGNGLLLVPNEITMPAANAPKGEAAPTDPDAPGLPPATPIPPALAGPAITNRQVTATDVTRALVQAASTAIQQPDSPASLIPVVLQAPGEFLDKIKHVKFGTEFTEVVMKLREAATKRLAIALDIPPEILLGTGGVNHWGAWQIEESGIKMHVEPLLTIICDRLTEFVLRPMLRILNHPDPESVVLWFSTDDLALRPNRSQDAKDLHAAGVIGSATLREAAGFTDADAPVTDTAAEQKAMAFELVKAAPQLLEQLAGILGLDLAPVASSSESGGQNPEPAADTSAPIPDEPDQIAASLAAGRVVVEMALNRALQLAGNRRRTRGNLSSLTNVAAVDTHTKLDPPPPADVPRLINGWSDACSDRVLAQARVDKTRLETLIRDYSAHALARRIPLSRIQIPDSDVRGVID